MFQNMVGMGNALDKPSQHKLDNFKNTMINEVIKIIGIDKVNSNQSKIPTKENIYNRTDGWLKTKRIRNGYNRVAIYDGPFKSGDTDIMVVDEVSCILILKGQEFRNLGR